jgi:filamentous hemagglutinin
LFTREGNESGYGAGNTTFNSGNDGQSSASKGNSSDLQDAANQPINDSGLSAAARAWDKHAGRPGGTFDPLTGSIADKNAAASEFVNSVLTDPASTRTELSRGGVEYRLPNGQGIRFNADGSFSGFLGPRNKGGSNDWI